MEEIIDHFAGETIRKKVMEDSETRAIFGGSKLERDKYVIGFSTRKAPISP